MPDETDLARLVHVFAKSVIPGSDQIRGQRITLLDDVDAYQIGKALGGMLVASVTGRTTNYVSGGERNSTRDRREATSWPPSSGPILNQLEQLER